MKKRSGKIKGKYGYLSYVGFKEWEVCKGKIQVLAEYPNAKKKKILGKLHKRYRILEKMLVDLNKFNIELQETFVDYDKQVAVGYNCVDKWFTNFRDNLYAFEKSIKSQIADIVQPALDKWSEKNYKERGIEGIDNEFDFLEALKKITKNQEKETQQGKDTQKEFFLERYRELSKELADLARQAVEQGIEL